ncbi:hypothetical protein J2S43_005969 [Catenuloplanes nepalensis]|uniref:Peptidase M41 domain-containing protein n=1 Tax=Catenuloplanes nepalensis TaxID=587533 RepID=A0ABT9N174_9ACTN|nr:hypothetical protein [Catenuloplanes nepalensis]MDP9797457.1 hypothetical protein [Catenuloplanes nepalensis]
MATRLIDVMCDRHRDETLTARCWPVTQPTCSDCGPTDDVTWFPGLDPKQELAVHEAGHAVVFQELGIPIVEAAAQPGHGLAGYTTPILEDQFAYASLVGWWAGQSATLHWLDQNGGLDEASTVDAVSVSRTDLDPLIAHVDLNRVATARALADALAASEWPAIEAVATELAVRGRLSGDETADLAEEALPCTVPTREAEDDDTDTDG